MNNKDTITEMVRSGFPVFYIYTEDEVSVILELKEIAKELEKEILEWTVNKGMLEDFLKVGNLEDSFLILTNPHFFLEEPVVIQTIKDKSLEWKSRGVCVFLVSNDKKIPPEINRNLTYLEFDLPDEKALGEKLEFIRDSAISSGAELEEFTESSKNLLVNAALGLTGQQAEDAFSLSIVRNGNLNSKTITEIKAGEYLKTGIMELEAPQPKEAFCGYDLLQKYILSIKQSFYSDSKFGLPSPKGILLVGVPGTGKTLASKAVASHFNLMLLKVDIGKVMSEYVGASERNMRLLIATAERMAPIVLRIDEIEKQLGGMTSSNNLDSGVGARVMAPLLSWMQDRIKPVFMIATANNIESLPPEMLRKGRFDEVFFLDLPNNLERISIFHHHISKRVTSINWNDKLDVDLVEMTKNWSGAEIEQIVIQALRHWENKHDRDDNFEVEEFLDLLKEEILVTVPLSVIRKDDIDKIKKWAVTNNARLASNNEQIEAEQEEYRRKIMI